MENMNLKSNYYDILVNDSNKIKKSINETIEDQILHNPYEFFSSYLHLNYPNRNLRIYPSSIIMNPLIFSG